MKHEPFLRVGACYYEVMSDPETKKPYTQYYIGYRRQTDGTLNYCEAEWWNGLFGSQGSDQGPYFQHVKKEKKKKKNEGEEGEEDDWGSDWQYIPDGTDDSDERWGKEFRSPFHGEQGGDVQEVSQNHTLRLAGPGQKVAAETAAAEKYKINFKPGEQEFPRVVETLESGGR